MANNIFFKVIFHVRFYVSVIFSSCVFLISFGICGQPNSDSTKKWVGCWATAPQLVETSNLPPSPGLTNNSLRQVVRVSIGGDTLRIKISNEFSTSSITMKSVHIATSTGTHTINVSSDKELKFNGNPEVTIHAGVAVTSDPIAFKLIPRMDVAITIYYGQTSTTITGHPGSRTTSYIIAGNVTTITDFTGSVTTDHWYNINTIDVLVPSSRASIAILGNSITDGRGSTTNLQNRWPDIFSESLLNDTNTQHIGILNMGIGGNSVLSGGLGPTGISRFERDILNQSGVRWAIVFEGVNDIGGVSSSNAASTISNSLIAAYKQMVLKTHAKNIRIYGSTIMPFNGNGYYNQYSELCRNTVNQWIRTKGNFDGVIDFDKIMRNPLDTTKLVSSFQNDGLHPDVTGHKRMGESIDLNLFKGTDSVMLGVNSKKQNGAYLLGQNYPNPFNPATNISFNIPSPTYVSLSVFDAIGREIADLISQELPAGSYTEKWNAVGFSSGIYFYRLQTSTFSETKKLTMMK